MTKDVIIKSTHRGLRYEDGKLTGVLEAGRYEVPERREGRLGGRRAVVEIILVNRVLTAERLSQAQLVVS